MNLKYGVVLGALMLCGNVSAANVTLAEINAVPEIAKIDAGTKQMYTERVTKEKFQECVAKMQAEPKESDGKIMMSMGRGGRKAGSADLYMAICVRIMAF